jgi:hypothetical protein
MILHHHLGLGDHFVCNGLVNYISRNHKIDLITKKHNCPTVSSLYCENSNVNIYPIDGINEITESSIYAKESNQDILYVGFNYCDPNSWDRSFYKQLNIDFIERYRFFKLPRTLPEQVKAPDKPFIFIHNESSDGLHHLNIKSEINNRFYVKKIDTNNLLGYINLITKAEEIHCINSSLFHLIDSLPCITNKLYYYNVRNHPCSFDVSYKWTRI